MIRRLLAAAARLANDPALTEPLVASTGLSPENVSLGLREHLETSATDDDLARLARAVTPASHVHVILSPSVFVAPLRAIALGLATGGTVTVRPSRREGSFARTLIHALGDDRVRVSDAAPEDIREGVIHAYGRDDTLASIRAVARVPVWGHGSGFGVALVTGDLSSAAEAVARDVVPFDQRGCLSPRLVYVVGDAAAFARLLFDALESSLVPRGLLDDRERADLRRWADAVRFAGDLHEGRACAVGVTAAALAPPTGRHLLVLGLREPTALPAYPAMIALGTDLEPLPRLPGVRVSRLGWMQRPPLDGPVDLRATTDAAPARFDRTPARTP